MTIGTDESAFDVDPAVHAEMRRINRVCHPSVCGVADREDLITYAKEIVALRARTASSTRERL